MPCNPQQLDGSGKPEEHHDIRLIPDDADFVMGFVVDDIREAMSELQAAGVELVNEPMWAAEAFDEPGLATSPGSGYVRRTGASTPSSRSPDRDDRATAYSRCRAACHAGSAA
jgi:hypothetical protein